MLMAAASLPAACADPASTSSIAAPMATPTAPSITSAVSVTPDAAPTYSGGTTACVATLDSAHASPSPTPVTRNSGV